MFQHSPRSCSVSTSSASRSNSRRRRAIDGLSTWGTYWRIVVPNSKGIFAAVASITFIASWNTFLWPLVVGRDQEMWTVQVALSTFLNSQSPQMTQLFAASAIAILPLLVGFVLLQRYIVEGVERTGISG